MDRRLRSLWVAVLVLTFSIIIFLSLDINGHRKQVFIADISPKPAAGILKVAFYAHRFRTYLGDGSITFKEDDWEISEYSDTATLTARSDLAVLTVRSYGAPLYVSFLSIPNGGVATIRDGVGQQLELDLRTATESIQSIVIGGCTSVVSSVPGTEFISESDVYLVYCLTLLAFSLLAFYQMRVGSTPNGGPREHPSPVREILSYAAPLMMVPLIFQFAFWPASAPHDGGLQWMEAAVPGHLNPAIVIPATLLFRLFTKLSISPAYAIFAQILLCAIAVSLVLRELRLRGVAWPTTRFAAITIALLPQYPTFVITLSKDTWNCLGLLLTTYSALALLRHYHRKGGTSTYIVTALLAVIILSAVFAGTMRPNTLPAIAVFILLLMSYLGKELGWRIPSAIFAIYILAVVVTPKVVEYLSIEHQAERSVSATSRIDDVSTGLPLGPFANFYIIHLFAAATNADIPLNEQDTRPFYKLAPKSAWQEYDCSYVDKTQLALMNSYLIPADTISAYWSEHQVEMATIVLKLMLFNPSVLFERQACVTRMLWHIGYHGYPFQVNATLGYDSVPDNFLAAVGGNHSLIGEPIRKLLINYVIWSESWTQMWLFWKPFLFLGFGLFSVLLYTIAQGRSDVLLVAALPLSLTVTLAVFIVFPAFRYQYPATLIFMILFLLAFARPEPCPAVVAGSDDVPRTSS